MNKKNKIQKYDNEKILEQFLEKTLDYSDAPETIMQGMAMFINCAMELTKLVITNSDRNSKTLSEEDIYAIYARAFKSVINTSPGNY